LDASGRPLGWLILALLVLLSAFFPAMEAVLLTVSRRRLPHLRGPEARRTGLLTRVLEDPSRAITGLLAAHTAAVVAASVLAAALAAPWLAAGSGLWLLILVGVAVVLIASEIAVKALAGRYADRLVPAIAADAVIEEDKREMIHSVVEFGETVVREVMVPRIDMVCVEDTTTVDGVLRQIIEKGHSRIPVYRETIDQIVGIVHVKDLLSHVKAGHHSLLVREVMRPAFFVPESKRLDDLLREMRRKRTQMAIVVDEYGGTAGLVTVEDLVEEIVGPILDEYDVDEKLFETVNDHTAIVDGRLSIEEVNELMGLELPAGEVDTIGGFVYSLLGHVPAQGEKVDAGEAEIVVEKLEGHRIARVRIGRRIPMQPLRP